MEKIILKVNTREALGKEAGRRLRKEGLIPAVVYKKAKQSMPITVGIKDLVPILRTSAGENVIITLEVLSDAGSKKPAAEKTVIIKEIQYHPVKGDILHCDFQEISLTEKIKVNIPIEARGESGGVRSDGGIFDFPIKELNIECLPTDIPEKIFVDVHEMKIGDAVRVKDLKLPAAITVLSDPEQTVVSVVPPEAEKPAEEEPEAAAEKAEPEVIKQKKPEPSAEAEQKK
ncbi:MAG: 50S ribosomal protein L25 [Candidatus Omnitrophica bacterium]|nr:50S ribosomal protein L25 [Candidatus Omnitrophota bacterium]